MTGDKDEMRVFLCVKVVWATEEDAGLTRLRRENEGVEFGMDGRIVVDLKGAFEDWCVSDVDRDLGSVTYCMQTQSILPAMAGRPQRQA